jgi:purine-nucleoside phosphorylase
MAMTALPIRVMRCLGVKLVIVTNAAGGLNPKNDVCDVINITDHFALPQLAGENCLIGPNDDELGPRFPPMSNAYDPECRKIVVASAKALKFDFVKPSGTYCFVRGPMYESAAECRFLASIGGDAVGMSTAPEIIAAHHCGMKVICLSLITNAVISDPTDSRPAASHAEVLEATVKRSQQIQDLVKHIVSNGGRDYVAGLPDLKEINLEGCEDKNSFGNLVKHAGAIAVAGTVAMLLARAWRSR